MSKGCSGKCPGCKNRQAQESEKSASLIQLVVDRIQGDEDSAGAATFRPSALEVAELLARASSFVV